MPFNLSLQRPAPHTRFIICPIPFQVSTLSAYTHITHSDLISLFSRLRFTPVSSLAFHEYSMTGRYPLLCRSQYGSGSGRVLHAFVFCSFRPMWKFMLSTYFERHFSWAYVRYCISFLPSWVYLTMWSTARLGAFPLVAQWPSLVDMVTTLWISYPYRERVCVCDSSSVEIET